jgi:hypothetical protein
MQKQKNRLLLPAGVTADGLMLASRPACRLPIGHHTSKAKPSQANSIESIRNILARL